MCGTMQSSGIACREVVTRLSVAAVAAIALAGWNASAAQACNPGRADDYLHQYERGWWNTTSGSWGKMKANVESQMQFVWFESGLDHAYENDSGVYTGLARLNAGTNVAYAFVGRTYDNNDVRHVETTYFGPSFGVPVYLLFPDNSNLGDTPSYAVRVNGSTKDFIVNGSVVWNADVSFTPNTGEVLDDLLTEANQVPGSTGDHEGITNAQVFVDPNGTGQDLDGSLFTKGGSASWFSTYKASASHYETWDTAC